MRLRPLLPALGLLGLLAGCSAGILQTQLEEAALCRDVGRTSEGRPTESTARFAVDDNQAVLWIRFSSLKDAHTVRFRWYDPWENVSLDTGDVPVNPEGSFRRSLTVSSPLPIALAPPSFLPGTWRVEAFYDGNRILEESFEISAGR